MQTLTAGLRWWFETLDDARRRRGAAMARMGYGPVETPSVPVFSMPGMRLRHYGGSPGARDIALIVPAPIKRHYIWDLAPDCSVVRRALQSGMQVYLIEWMDPTEAEEGYGLEEYGHALIDAAVGAIRKWNPSGRLFLLGHSLGGVFAAMYSAAEAKAVDALVLIEAPQHFASDSGAFTPLVTFGPPAADVARLFGRIPGSVLSMTSVIASPSTFQFERSADFVASLGSQKHTRTHLQVERWTLDEAPMPGRLFEQVVEQLYRKDQFMRGILPVNGRNISPHDITCPLLSVYDPRSIVIPPASIIPFHHAASSRDKRLLAYKGDTGVALSHVGVLMGESAHRQLWPEIFDWLTETAAPRH